MTRSTRRMIGQIYPWDLVGHPARALEWQRGGLDELAIASSYHAVRALSWMPDGSVSVRQQNRSSHHLPPTAEWAGGVLRPRPPVGLPDDLFTQSVRITEEAGLDVRAWVVLTHLDHDPDSAEAEYAAVDLFGNRSSFSLCPSHPAVRQYARGLLEDVLRQTGVDSFLIESLQTLGFRHLVAHDKSAFSALSEAQLDVLSLCFCSACVSIGERTGIDLARNRAALRAGFSHPGAQVHAAMDELDTLRRSVSMRFLDELAQPVDGHPLHLELAATAARAYGPFAAVDTAGAATGLVAELSAPGGSGWRDASVFATWDGCRVAGTLSLNRAGQSIEAALAASDPHRNPPVDALDALYLYHLGTQSPADFAALHLARFTARTSHTEREAT